MAEREVSASTTTCDDTAMSEQRPSFCRVCHNACPILVQVEEGRVTRVTGDRGNAVYDGYTCVKGRALPELHNSPDRLLRPLRRRPDGAFETVELEDALDEIAGRLEAILDRHGPQAIAGYVGTYTIASAAIYPIFQTFMDAIGSRMRFDPSTIDQPGKMIAKGLHGMWMAPPQAFDRPEVALLIGTNPLITYTGLPIGNPGKYLSQAIAAGMKLIVIDPRRTDVAKRAHLFLQPRPGHDAAILAALLRVILVEERYDRSFVEDNVDGISALRAEVEPFTPEAVGALADVDPDALVAAARAFADAGRGYAVAGTGPSMSGSGVLFEYLVLNLTTLCGRWLRAGETVAYPGVLKATVSAKAQAAPPFPAYALGEPLRVRGLTPSLAGMPTAALADEILLPGEGQVRALISCGGNPAACWPDQHRAVEALRELDLFVQIDPWMSQSATLADYVIPPKLSLEKPGMTYHNELFAQYANGFGPAVPHAQYSPAIVEAPQDSSLIEEWEFFYRIAQRMALPLRLTSVYGTPITPVEIDMEIAPSTDQVFEWITEPSRIPLDEVRRHPGGGVFADPPLVVEPKDPGWTGRLDVANKDMMRDLAAVARTLGGLKNASPTQDDRPFRLLCRRVTHMYNSSTNIGTNNRGRRHNPAYMNPEDLEMLGVGAGDVVEISSMRASILGIVEVDAGLRRGLVSMTHGFGGLPDEPEVTRDVGGATARLSGGDLPCDPYSGQPQMSNIPVSVRPARHRGV